ncbi:FmdB family zinc ribbon protein [Nitrospira moscoviensis]|uniref:Putative Regulatory protein, FmdB family n=1 Tax=Nitrospira moscoviensis TaxID=42253 RepID=A0A0K2G8X6_NITMO|nr:zinc ribbon domain-containing protein [Nitrospira moscoviensis]ALA57395.1 putative Regulatory protein, FmdB family [Nitrospira moscoviensis]
MPIYEYLCQDCRKRSAILVISHRNASVAACRHCGSQKMERLMSRFAAPKSEEARLESLADPSHIGDIDENDPHSVARFMKKMGDEMGEDLGDDMEAMMEQAGDGAEDGERTAGTDGL